MTRAFTTASTVSTVVLVSLSLLLLGASGPKVKQPKKSKQLMAGACAVKITPEVGVNHTDPIYMAGFGTNRASTGVHDDLWARGVVLEARGKKIALVTLDLVGYFYNEVLSIRSLVDPARGFDSITVTSTHNHEGPDSLGIWGEDDFTSGVDLGYLDFVNDSVVACIEAADDNLVPAAIKFATGSTMGASLPPWPDLVADGKVLAALEVDRTLVGGEGVVQVEGDAGPIINPAVPTFQIASIERRKGKKYALVQDVMATLVNYASHPESLGSDNTLITADFPHYMREALEAQYGGIAIYMSADLGVLQGPLDVDVPDTESGAAVERRTFEFAARMGELLAERASMALDAGEKWKAKPKIQAKTRGPLVVDVENPFFRAAGVLGVFGRRPFRGDGAVAETDTEAQLLRIGPAQILVTPNEVDPQIANDYREAMTEAKHHFIAGLGNDEIGYQMPSAKFNPSCFLCFQYILLGDEEGCPYFGTTLDCGTVFQNNIGPSLDTQLQEQMQELISDLN